MRRNLMALCPLACTVGPWLFLGALGGRDAVGVITGSIPPGMGPEAFILGFAYVAASLLATVCGPPVAVGTLVFLLGGARR